MALALYRLYRPKTFDEVVGQEHITTVLKNQLCEQKLSHAYLFVGSRGTGKTTCAKLLAKAVNCIGLQDANPCGTCEHCVAVENGTSLDVIEIDAASNNGVDDIRQLRDEAVFTPVAAKYRVYIIDEVHMLSNSAFNALLKILEEPPRHVIFILATTEIHKVLPTIVSRCQRFDFHRIESGIIQQRLLQIAHMQSFDLSQEAAELIARLSDGGMRDALSLLDVCWAYSSHIDVDVVSNAVGIAGAKQLLILCDAIIAQDSSEMINQVCTLLTGSLDPQRLCEQLIGHYRNLMLIKTVKNPAPVVGCLASEIELLKEQCKRLTLSQIMTALTLLQDSWARMSKSLQKRAELELCLLTLTEPSAQNDASSLLARIEKLEVAVRKGILLGVKSAEQRHENVESSNMQPPQLSPTPLTEQAQQAEQVFEEKVQCNIAPQPFAQWSRVLDEIANTNKSLYGMLSNTKAYYDGKRILIDVQNPVLLNMLKTNEYTKSSIKEAITLATGNQIPIGPYKQQKNQQDTDPLDALISALDGQNNVIIR